MRRFSALGMLAMLAVPCSSAHAQFGFTTAFKPAEFSMRRAKIMERIGDGVAVIQGSAEIPGSLNFRQGNQFFYLTGVEVPRSVLIIDGKTRSSTLFLPGYNAAEVHNGGPVIIPDEASRRTVGVEHVMIRDSIMSVLTRLAADGRTFYAPFGGEVRGASYTSHVIAYDKANAADPLDGRLSREQQLVAKLKALSGKDVQDLDPIENSLRALKSPAEIAVIREASRVAGLGLMEAMRATKPGRYEYQLGAAADFVFRNHNAQGFGYGAIIAVDTNAVWIHYRRAQSRMAAGSMLLMDYAPDINYYTSDVTRSWPVSGKFTPRERELYSIYIKLFQAVESSMKPNTSAADISKEAVTKMDRIFADFHFTDPKIKTAASLFIDKYRKGPSALGHTVGMAVHDVGSFPVLTPGMVFALEPDLTIPDERLSVRIENVYLVTDTKVENLSPEAPVDIEGIERVMRERGITEHDGPA
ncbi:MAG: Xaa-Pro peptidase family protein [Gemmatimonadaceae bacterium]